MLSWLNASPPARFNKDFTPTGEEPEDTDFDMPKVYEPMESFESLMDRLDMFLSHYNESIRGAGMDMVFFRDAMIHLVKVKEPFYGMINTQQVQQDRPEAI